ncbi:AraC family transcriptional regulator [Stutzerimonas tarimensis]|uniref:AraC family transcriptional regulator n=1 Tax=Stutzerimonas tarimensis TaxID=1507735 RepID=A0ABV7T9E0_9GAMM
MTHESTSTSHTIAIFQVRQILQGARRHGYDVEPLLIRAGISPLLLDSPLSRVSQLQYARLLSLLRKQMRDEYVGLCSRPVKIGSFARLCEDLVRCQRLGEALRSGFSFSHLLIDDFSARLIIDRGMAHVRIRATNDADPVLAFAERMFLFFSLGVASWLVGRRLPLLQVHYRGAPCGRRDDLYRIFQAPVSFEHDYFGYSFESRWLELPVVQHPLTVKDFVRQAPATLLIKYRDETSLSERIRRLLRRHLDQDLPTLDEVGETLGLTPQTLRRRLRDEGECYQSLKDRLRCDAAIEYLGKPELSLVDIASMVGFSEPSTFHRAFKKWTGLPPGEYRTSRLSAAARMAAIA